MTLAVALGLVMAVASAGATPAAPPAGYFRVAQRDGRWWFVAPGGNEYLFRAANVVESGPDLDKVDVSNTPYCALRAYPTRDAWADETRRRFTT